MRYTSAIRRGGQAATMFNQGSIAGYKKNHTRKYITYMAFKMKITI